MNETDPRKVLREARQLVKSQQYAAALQNYIWLHDHALEYDQRMAGVRLSYAISEWIELGDVYPPARKALETVRDAKTQALMQGTHDAKLFHDVASINGAFGQRERTAELFKFIAGSNREAAAGCFRIALESLIHTKDFGLALTFLSDPRKEIDQFADSLKMDGSGKPSVEPEMFQEVIIRLYVNKVGLILSAFAGAGEEREANCLRDYAIQRVTDAQLRDRITERLYPTPPSTRIQ